MAFVEADRVQIRTYLGYAAIFLQADPRLESAITAVQAVQTLVAAAKFGYDPGTVVPDPAAVGGTRPDSSTETQVRLLIQKLQGVDDRLDALGDMMGMEQLDDGSFSPQREDARQRRLGRMYAHRLAKILDTNVRSDVFATSSDGDDEFRAGPAYAPDQFAARARRAY